MGKSYDSEDLDLIAAGRKSRERKEPFDLSDVTYLLEGTPLGSQVTSADLDALVSGEYKREIEIFHHAQALIVARGHAEYLAEGQAVTDAEAERVGKLSTMEHAREIAANHLRSQRAL